MKYKNICVWLIGCNATGKTTQAALLHKKLAEGSELLGELHEFKENDSKYYYTKLSTMSSNVGKFRHPILFSENVNECCGTDTVNLKENIVKAYNFSLEETPIVVVEGIMATGQWIDFLKTPTTFVLLVHLDIDLETNLERLVERRARKKGVDISEIQFVDKTVDNFRGKISGFRSLFNRMTPLVDSSITIDSAAYSIEQIHGIIYKKLQNICLLI